MAKQKPTLNEADLDLIEKRFESKFPTREDMDKRFEAFLEAVKSIMEVTIDEKIEDYGLVTKEDIKHLPTKDEYYENEAKVMKELKAIREERTVQAHQISRNSDRLDRVEKHTGLPAFE